MNPPPPKRACGALLAALLASLSGCGILGEGDPETARVVIDGAPGHPVRLVATTDFDVVSSPDGEEREVYIFSADTTDVTPPVDRSYSLGPRTRFYIVVDSDSVAATAVRVTIYVDGDRRYDRSTRFGDEALTFLYAASSG